MKNNFIFCVLFALFLLSNVPAQEKGNTKEILSSGNGRFVFGQISDFRRDQYMLDTQTGRLWKIVVNDKEIASLDPILYNSLDGMKTIEPEEPQIQLKRVRDLMEKKQDSSEPDLIKQKK